MPRITAYVHGEPEASSTKDSKGMSSCANEPGNHLLPFPFPPPKSVVSRTAATCAACDDLPGEDSSHRRPSQLSRDGTGLTRERGVRRRRRGCGRRLRDRSRQRAAPGRHPPRRPSPRHRRIRGGGDAREQRQGVPSSRRRVTTRTTSASWWNRAAPEASSPRPTSRARHFRPYSMTRTAWLRLLVVPPALAGAGAFAITLTSDHQDVRVSPRCSCS